jgi:ribosomal protein S18 acetylase RimI-like enzyme
VPSPAVEVRAAAAEQYAAIAELTATTYLSEGYGDADYATTLRDVAGRAAQASVLVAQRGGELLGAVAVATDGGPYAEQSDPGEAVIRMLVVAPEARGAGAGTALMQACLDRALAAGCTTVRLSTQVTMTAAHRIYHRLGFVRTPDRDWEPVPGLTLLTYELPLAWCELCGRAGTHARCRAALELEPPRYCPACRRRMVVQVTPTGWTARCAEHGATSSN